MFVIALVPIVLGVLVGWGGFLGLREKLPRDRGAGVRTAATMRSEDAFRLGNKVAGLPTLAGGVIAVLAGAAALVMPTTFGLLLASVVGMVGMIALVAAGGVLGNRAAATVPAPEPAAPEAPAGCSGCACGTCGVFKKADTATA
ncbi:SdpI family protein [Amycolatopsis regifaucium]|uniref:SdpI family protein n=1 Tax=Amycolatopsis regifaucium TaxID=546365 RepID=A0A154MLK5_9PSEU|nr:SdpI family protein [Amycolatopsis regifaucium]KZB84920.1 hypothetical protein AVL48_01545 [Amycolatopsis regifaucium]OKA03937.1 hypothetical protein ATP06_0232400 [Amycolatopsis regifaucium]SFI00164.1 SdpI/YhfL protein family protein [Amycolatopsis regifaucium]